jgi:hypothetical protein
MQLLPKLVNRLNKVDKDFDAGKLCNFSPEDLESAIIALSERGKLPAGKIRLLLLEIIRIFGALAE